MCLSGPLLYCKMDGGGTEITGEDDRGWQLLSERIWESTVLRPWKMNELGGAFEYENTLLTHFQFTSISPLRAFLAFANSWQY
jgi:hypothetical protein